MNLNSTFRARLHLRVTLHSGNCLLDCAGRRPFHVPPAKRRLVPTTKTLSPGCARECLQAKVKAHPRRQLADATAGALAGALEVAVAGAGAQMSSAFSARGSERRS